MYIQEAVKEVLKRKGKRKNINVIRRKGINNEVFASDTCIYPTNTYDCCILMCLTPENDPRQSRYWNPTADDLIADDWEIVNVKKIWK